MRKSISGWLVALGVALAPHLARAAPLEAYGKLPTMDHVSLSPDGTKVAFVQQVGGKYTAVVDQLNPASIVIELPPTNQVIRGLIWADATHLLILKSQAGNVNTAGMSYFGEWLMVQSLDLQSRKAKVLFTRPSHGNVLNAVTKPPQVRTVNGHTVVFGHGIPAGIGIGGDALMTADLTTGDEDVIDVNGASGRRDWLVGDDGAIVARTVYDEAAHLWTLYLNQNGHWVTSYSAKAAIEQPDAMGLSEDGAAMLLEMVAPDARAEVHLVSLRDGKIGDAEPRYNTVSDFMRAPQTERVIGGVEGGMEQSYVFFDPGVQAAWDAVLKAFADEQVDPVSWSNDWKKVVVRVTGARHGVAYVVVDLVSHQAATVGRAFDGISADDIADINIVKYPAADGQSIEAFLTLPIGREPKNLPLIVLPHGGPAARDDSGFDWLSQALASRGYAVLQPQFRGSAGFGWALETAGFGEFGRKMQSDLSDGVRALAAKGYIDPKRVCIVGASYGGYAALAGVTIEQGVYRCAVAVAGVSDLHKLIGGMYADAAHSSSVRYWDRFVGAKDPSDPVFDKISPLKHADQASAPILLIHGHDDIVVPMEQSLNMESALKRANKPVEFVFLSSEDHWLSREPTRLQMLQATVAFLEKNNPPK